MQDVNYPDQDQLDPPGIQIRLAGDILWLAVTGFACAVIIGILCWPISAARFPRILAGATLASPTVKSALGMGASPVASTTSNAAPTEPNGTEFSPFHPNADRPSVEPLTYRAKLTPASRAQTAKPIGRRAFAIPPARLTSSTPASPTASAGRALTKVGAVPY